MFLCEVCYKLKKIILKTEQKSMQLKIIEKKSMEPKFDSLKRYTLPERAPSYTICKLMQQLWETVWRFLKKLKIELPYNPAIPLLGIFPKKTS